MNWQDVFQVVSGMSTITLWYSFYIIDKRTNEVVKGSLESGYDYLNEAFEAAELLFNRLENDVENILLEQL